MAKLIEYSKAPLKSTDLRGLTGRRPLPCVCGKWTGSGSSNYPGRNRNATGVENAPKSSVMMNNAERGNTVTSPCATRGKPTVRQADGGTVVRGWKKRMPSCNGTDTVCDRAEPKSRGGLYTGAEWVANVQQVFHCEIVWRIF